MLLRQIEEDEWDILTIVTDPVLLGEFLRNTSDGSPNREEWPTQHFGYRWYQKDLLTDKSEFISLVAGRAVGKCSPVWSRVYTAENGYMSIFDMLRHAKKRLAFPLTVYCINDKKELIQSRVKVSFNKEEEIFRVRTAGQTFEGTANHPLLTERGWVMISDIKEEDRVAVVTWLPTSSNKASLAWEELRWMGYIAGYGRINPEMNFHLRFQRSIVEMKRIAYYFDANFKQNANGTYLLERKRGPLKHYTRHFISDMHVRNTRTTGFVRIPYYIKNESLAQLKIFLEAFFSNWADFTKDTIEIRYRHKTFTLDIQELLLRLGISSKVSPSQDGQYVLTIDEYNSYYTFFKELDIPGVSATNLRIPNNPIQFTDFARFEDIISIDSVGIHKTYALTVRDHENYISDNLIVHNSLVLEDKIIYGTVNVDSEFPVTKESTLVTANVSQMTPIIDHLILRLSNSFFLRDFLKGNVNRSKGTLDFPQPGGSNYRINARIAGSRGENNMVGLHVPKIIGDEMQIFPMAAFTQLQPEQMRAA